MTVTRTSGVVTPEAVLLEFQPAGLATRSLAKMVDVFAQMILLMVLLMLSGFLFVATASTVFLTVMQALSLFLVLFFVPALLETVWNGRTPGKALLGLRVLTVDGGPITFRHAMVRGILQIVEIPTGLAVFVALCNRRSQRIGDLAAGTFVISERGFEQRIVPIAFYPPPGWEEFCHALDVSRVEPEQFLLIRNFLLRVNRLAHDARYGLAVRLATPLRSMCSPAPPPQMQPELFLICVCAAYQIRHGGLPPRPMAYGVGFPGGYPSGPPTGRVAWAG